MVMVRWKSSPSARARRGGIAPLAGARPTRKEGPAGAPRPKAVLIGRMTFRAGGCVYSRHQTTHRDLSTSRWLAASLCDTKQSRYCMHLLRYGLRRTIQPQHQG